MLDHEQARALVLLHIRIAAAPCRSKDRLGRPDGSTRGTYGSEWVRWTTIRSDARCNAARTGRFPDFIFPDAPLPAITLAFCARARGSCVFVTLPTALAGLSVLSDVGLNKECSHVFQRNAVRTISMLCTLCVLLAACGTTPAPDYRGSWRPLNTYSQAPIELPLSSAYIFQASPMDGTLKTMLSRWAKDSGMKLDYRFGSDFTLYGPVAQIDTTDVRDAAAQLTSAYGQHGVRIDIAANTIIVAPAASPAVAQ